VGSQIEAVLEVSAEHREGGYQTTPQYHQSIHITMHSHQYHPTPVQDFNRDKGAEWEANFTKAYTELALNAALAYVVLDVHIIG
jgi:hypothetical protein